MGSYFWFWCSELTVEQKYQEKQKHFCVLYIVMTSLPFKGERQLERGYFCLY
jgi:hypothetical protein